MAQKSLLKLRRHEEGRQPGMQSHMAGTSAAACIAMETTLKYGRSWEYLNVLLPWFPFYSTRRN